MEHVVSQMHVASLLSKKILQKKTFFVKTAFYTSYSLEDKLLI